MDFKYNGMDTIREFDVEFKFKGDIYRRVYNGITVYWYSNEIEYKKECKEDTWYKPNSHRNHYVKCAIPDIEIAYQRMLLDFPKEPDYSYIITGDELGLI